MVRGAGHGAHAVAVEAHAPHRPHDRGAARPALPLRRRLERVVDDHAPVGQPLSTKRPPVVAPGLKTAWIRVRATRWPRKVSRLVSSTSCPLPRRRAEEENGAAPLSHL